MSQSTIQADQKGDGVAEDSDAEGFAPGGGGEASAAALGLTGASRARADAFLAEQTRLARAQVARLEAQDDHLAEEQRGLSSRTCASAGLATMRRARWSSQRVCC